MNTKKPPQYKPFITSALFIMDWQKGKLSRGKYVKDL